VSEAAGRELAYVLQAGWPVIAFESFEEDRSLRVLRAAASACQRELVTWSAAAGLSDDGAGAGSLDEALCAISTREQPTVFGILDAHSWLGDPLAIRRLRDQLKPLVKRRQAVVLLGPVLSLPPELMRETARLDLPLPKADELRPLFERVQPGDPDLIASAVRASLGLTETEALRVLRKSAGRAGGLNSDTVANIVAEKRQALRRTPALTFHDSVPGMGDVGGLGELKRWLRERRRAFEDDARVWGLPMPRGLLLLGVQGCGKSLSAKAVAREWQFPLLRLDLAAAFGGHETTPEAAIQEAMAVAESLSPAVLWIDEIEKGFSASGTDVHSGRVFGSFLTWLSEKQSPVFVVATANDVNGLPPELLRRGRFDELFFVDLPTAAEREEIFAIHLGRQGRDPFHYPIEALAAESERLSGAEIEQVVSAALYTAFAESRELTDNDLINAISETVPLYDTYEERIKELRDWARSRARAASLDVRIVDLFKSAIE
jgi:AAA+ superfamily predicted ATPase